MAKANIESVRLRPNTIEENRAVLREIQAKKEVDARKQDELNELFDGINAECASRSLKEKRKALASPGQPEKVIKTVHYGPLPGFPSGTWWGIRMDCSRDCIHEPFNENIHDGPFGAVSICTSHLNTYNDVDLGDILTFTSQEYSATENSKDSLTLSYKNRVPIRLVRSYNLSNDYAPKTGYRYDGLYTVIYHWVGVSLDSTKYQKFVLTRVLDQECPPWNEKAPSSKKVIKFRKCSSPRLTRSHKNVSSQENKTKKFVYKQVQKEPKATSVSSIVSRQVFKKYISGSPSSSPKSLSGIDSAFQNSCSTNSCQTNLSIRTNLYDSSHKQPDVKKSTNVTFCRLYKSNQSIQLSQKSLQKETEKISVETSDSDTVDKIPSVHRSSADEYADKKVKKVTWADSCNSTLCSIEKTLPTTGNGFQYSGSGVVDGFSPTSSKKCGVLKYKNMTEDLPLIQNSKSNGLLSSSTKSSQHIVQIHSRSNVPQTSRASFSTMCESFNETEEMDEPSSSIDSLAPDKLVNLIVKEKYHPMAKLLIGNMIGLQNEESAILSAYNTLTSKVDQDDSKKSKENKLRNKFYIRNKSRKNGVLKTQRREIANLIIDAKFDTVTRGSRSRRLRSPRKRICKSELPQRKLMSARRIPSRNLKKEIRSSVRELQPKKPDKRKTEDVPISKRPKMVTSWTQCTLLSAPSVDQCLQVGEPCREMTSSGADIKVELVDLDNIKSEPCDVELTSEETSPEPDTSFRNTNYFSGSAFAAVNTVDSSLRIARLRSIGFRPIGTYSPIEDEDSNEEPPRINVDEEYNKYTNEETIEVGYMDEQLHFEDIEKEEMDITEEYVNLQETTEKQSQNDFVLQPIETLTEEDFEKPWHGWKKISVDGQVYWTGY